MFLSNQLEASSEKRPGSNGSKSARIFSKSTAGVVANGNAAGVEEGAVLINKGVLANLYAEAYIAVEWH